MDYPTPRFTGGKWHLDLRTPWNLGRYVVDAPPPPEGEQEARNQSWLIFLRERDRAAILSRETSPELPGLDGGMLFGAAVDAYLDYRANVKRWRRGGGERWTREVAARLKQEFGKRPLLDFAPPSGTRMLVTYRDLVRKGTVEELARAGFGKPLRAKRMKDVLIVLQQVLRFAAVADRLWLPSVPEMPDARIDSDETIRNALDKWVDEATFRAARDKLYADPVALHALLRELKKLRPSSTVADAHDLICRRKLFLSFAFYTGMRRFDLWAMDDKMVSPDLGRYRRFAHKTGADVSIERCPPPLLADLRVEQARLGRPWRRGEAICGGRWKNVARVMSAACDRVGVERFNLMDCRRSFVWHMALAGKPEADIVRLLGHTDSRMIRTVYEQHMPGAVVDETTGTWPEMVSVEPGTGPARVIPFARK
jgi:integrase